MNKTQTEKLINLTEKVSNVIYMNKFHLIISDETENEFIINNNYGDIVNENEDIRYEFLVTSEILGFKNIDQNCLEKSVKKNDKDLHGNWIKLVKYKNWIVRVAHETNTHYLIIINKIDIPELGLQNIENTNYSYKWLIKSK